MKTEVEDMMLTGMDNAAYVMKIIKTVKHHLSRFIIGGVLFLYWLALIHNRCDGRGQG